MKQGSLPFAGKKNYEHFTPNTWLKLQIKNSTVLVTRLTWWRVLKAKEGKLEAYNMGYSQLVIRYKVPRPGVHTKCPSSDTWSLAKKHRVQTQKNKVLKYPKVPEYKVRVSTENRTQAPCPGTKCENGLNPPDRLGLTSVTIENDCC